MGVIGWRFLVLTQWLPRRGESEYEIRKRSPQSPSDACARRHKSRTMKTYLSHHTRFIESLALGIIAAIGSLSSTTHAQVGTGWIEFSPTGFLDVQSSGDHTHYPLSNYLRV